MMARDISCDSMLEQQCDICASFVTLGVALFLPKRHQWDYLTALTTLSEALGENPTPAHGLAVGVSGLV